MLNFIRCVNIIQHEKRKEKIMLKKLLCVCSLLGLGACDNVDVSKYPDDVQDCYYDTISSDNNCTKNKKTIIRFCECVAARKAKIKEKIKADGDDVQSSIVAFVERHKIHKGCAKDTGYTYCKTDE